MIEGIITWAITLFEKLTTFEGGVIFLLFVIVWAIKEGTGQIVNILLDIRGSIDDLDESIDDLDDRIYDLDDRK